jgi:uncharacterized RDD family membrane protein YckC
MNICPKCGKENLDQARFCQSCGTELSPSRAVSVVYAGFWQRVAAMLIDMIVVSFGAALLFGVANIVGGLASLFLPWIYEAAMLSSEKQATIGKMAVGIVVTDLGGRRLSFGRATGRHFAKYLSGFILGIGFLMAAFTEKKQTLHDKLAETVVLASRPTTSG